ncbi:MAG TPA: ArdC family protein [Armatimonadota bacterium]|jgi:antirestriction protein ArdC
MTQQDARAAVDRALDTLAQQLDAGRSGAMTAYLTAMARFRSYSWGNQVLLYVQDPDATHVAGYQAWKSLGRQVKGGEKGLMILAPCQSRRVAENDDNEDGSQGQTTVRHFRAVHVFDIRQTMGEDLPEPPRAKGDPGIYAERLERFITEDLGVTIEAVASLGGALGRSLGGRIEILRDLAPDQRFATLAHEAGHELLHWALPEKERRDKTLVETEAEAVSFIACQAIGLETNTASSDYISLYRGNREALRLSIAAIHRAAGPMLSALISQVEDPRKETPRRAPHRNVHAGIPFGFGRQLTETPGPKVGDYVRVADIPEAAVFIDDSRAVNEQNVEYAREIGAYGSFFIVAADGEVTAVYGMHGIVPWLDRDTVLVHRR